MAHCENIYKWTAVINGPVSSSMIIDSRCGDQMPKYPFKTPKVKFLTPIHHPNVDDSGRLLKAESWKPSTKASSILMAISQLLEEPSPDDALVASIAETYKSDRALFDKQAAEHTKKHAMGK
ncbi:hypothetical protein OC845_006171 [Tilletia horrida]|nr:hypothetical protein OC845_006171 [Tilletia horrida]